MEIRSAPAQHVCRGDHVEISRQQAKYRTKLLSTFRAGAEFPVEM